MAQQRLVDFLAEAFNEKKAVIWYNDVLPRITPEAARENGNVGQPLHYAAGNKAPLEVVDALLKAYPGGAMEEDISGRLPIHYAAQNKAPVEVVVALLKAYPEGAREKDGHGQLPLHYAAANQVPLEVVDALLKAYPEGSRKKDGDGRLHLQVQKLLEQYRSEGRTADAAVLQQLFFRAVDEGDVESFNSLLKLGVDVNQGDDEGITPATSQPCILRRTEEKTRVWTC